MRRASKSRKRSLEVEDEENEGTESTSTTTSPNSSTPPKKKRKQQDAYTEEEEIEFEQNVLDLIEEHSKDNPDKKVLTSLMTKTLPKHRHWITDECPKVEDILLRFPTLSQSFNAVS